MKSPRSRLLLFAAFLLVFPFFLRRRPRVEQRITILARPEAIFPFLNDLRNWPLWTVWDRRNEIDYEYGSITAGDGAEQRWASHDMSGVLRILKSDRDERIDYELLMGEGTYEVVGRLELHPDGACTRVVWKCAWDLAKNPYRRYFDLLMRWMMRRDYAAGLENLKALVESSPKPAEVVA
ncbi:MAG TPA: SRPBCC family protein [Chthoniobacter sp.]|nr:SRPBCC family protein [Chthoniobacter sp.]